MQVKQILATKGSRVVTTAADATLRDAARTLEKERIGAMVVVGVAESVIGIVSERDIVRAFAREGDDVGARRVSEVMSSSVVTCAPEDSIEHLMREMTSRRFRHMPVVSGGRLAGMISIGDVVKWRLEELEAEAETLKEYIVSSR